MPKVMLRKGKVGQIVFYVAKQDLEAEVVSLQFDQADKWGGEIVLNDGSKFFVEPLDAPPDPRDRPGHAALSAGPRDGGRRGPSGPCGASHQENPDWGHLP